MLIVYVKRTGKIKNVCSGDLQCMAVMFGAEAEDYALIWDEITIPDDDNVVRNQDNYRVNPETKVLEMLPIANPYPIAQI